MATLLVLFVGWALLGGLWLLCRVLELRDTRSVDAFEASRSVLSAVTGRTSPTTPSVTATPEAHVRVLGCAVPRADPAAQPRRRSRRPAARDRRGPAGSRPARIAAGVAARPGPGAAHRAPGRGGAPEAGPRTPPVALRFGDDGPPDLPSGAEDPAAPASRLPRRRSRRPTARVAGQVGAVAAGLAALVLLASHAPALLGGGEVIPSTDVEPVPVDRVDADRPATSVVGLAHEPRAAASASAAPEVVEPTTAGRGTLTVAARRLRSSLELVARDEVWVELRQGGPAGTVVWTGLLPAGESYRGAVDVPAHVRIGNPGGLDVLVDGRRVPLQGTTPVNLVVAPPAA